MAESNTFKELVEILTRPRVAFALGLFSLLCHWLPLPARMEEYRPYAIPAFFLALCFYIAEMYAYFVYPLVTEHNQNKKNLKMLDSLNWYEAQVLLSAVDKGCQTHETGSKMPQINSLDKKHFIKVIRLGQYDCTYTVERYVWEELKKPQVQTMLKAIPRHN